MAERVPARLTVRKGRDFGLTVGAAFLILAALLWWRAQGSLAAVLTLPTDLRFRHGLSVTFALLGAALALAGVALPTRLGGLERAWMYLAHAISKVTTPIFMGVVYFVVTPRSASECACWADSRSARPRAVRRHGSRTRRGRATSNGNSRSRRWQGKV